MYVTSVDTNEDQVIEPYTNLPLKKLNWVKNIRPIGNGVSFDIEMITNAYPKYDEVGAVSTHNY